MYLHVFQSLRYGVKIAQLRVVSLRKAHKMSFRIDRVGGNGVLLLLLSGKLTGEHVDTLRMALEEESGTVAIDLRNVLLVDRDAVQFLALAEDNGTELRNCPKYVREWVNRERAARQGRN